MATTIFLRNVKLIFLTVMGGIFALFIVSSIALDDTIYANENYLFAKGQSAWYRVKYSFISAPNVLAGVDNVFNSPEFYNPNLTHAQSIPILNYHGIERSWNGNLNTISQRAFERQMFALKEAGYQTVTLDDLYQFLRGEKQLPPRSIVITFDDGRRDSLYGADPILGALGFTASMFVISNVSTGEEGGGYYLSEEELRRADKSGNWEIEAHAHEGHADFPIDAHGAVGNFYSNKLWLQEEGRLETDREYLDRTASDLVRVKRALEGALDEPVTYFAFPFGEYGQVESNAPELMPRFISIAHSLYDMLFYQHAPGVYFRQAYPEPDTEDTSFMVRRISVGGDWSAEKLLETLELSNAKLLPYEDVLREDRGWISAWGDYSIEPSQGLTLNAADGELGASIILDGTGHWRDYTLTALLHSPTQSGAFIWVRFKDEQNNAACNFGRDFVHVEQTVDGDHRVIQGVRPYSVPAEPFTASVRVEGRTIECLLNGEVVVRSDFLDPSLESGGIGFKKWNSVPQQSSLTLKRLEVSSLESEETVQTP